MKAVLSFAFVYLFVLTVYGNNVTIDTGIKVDSVDSSVMASANSQADSINISQMVAAQIEQARRKQLAEKSQPKAAETKTLPDNTTQTTANFPSNLPVALNISFGTMMKISIMGVASVMAVLIIFIRRKRFNKTFRTKRSFKDNIKLLREEKIIAKKYPKLSDVRNKLGNSPSIYNYSKEGISKAARELNISQGEIMLAAKIKAHELSKTWSTK